MSVLPASIDYPKEVASLPEGSSAKTVAVRPANGSSFGASSTIQFDLPQNGFMDGKSLYLRYRATVANAATQSSTVIGIPAYSYFNRVATYMGATLVESLGDYSQTASLLYNLRHDIGNKLGGGIQYGFIDTDITSCDGQTLSENGSEFYAPHVICCLSEANEMIPLGALPQVRMEFSIDAIANIFFDTASAGEYAPNSITLDNLELVYNSVDFGPEVMNHIAGEKFLMKTNSFMNSAVALASGSTGTYNLSFSQRLSSIKALYACLSPATRNRSRDSVDITAGTGNFQFNVAGNVYPQSPLSTLNNKAGFMASLKDTVDVIGSKNGMSINRVEFERADQASLATTADQPGKFYPAVKTEVLHNDKILTGVSSQGSNITLNVSQTYTTQNLYNVHLISAHDMVLEVEEGMVSVRV